MRRLVGILFVVTLVVGLFAGCGEDAAKPKITQLHASESCGVAPLRVDFRGDATAGEPLDDPTGANNWLEFTWDFGDGTVIEGGTSVAYHEYLEPGMYVVTLTAEDNNGDRASRSETIEVRADSLTIDAYVLLNDEPVTEVPTCAPLDMGVTAESCDFDPVVDSYERFTFRWSVADTVYTAPFSRHFFGSEDVGEQTVGLLLEDPARSITRRDSVSVSVVESEGADLSLDADWLLSPQGTEDVVLMRDVPSFSDTLTYTIRLANDGPDQAYQVEVVGEVDDNNRLFFHEANASHGSFVFVEDDDQWTWFVEALPAGDVATLDVTIFLEQGNAGNRYFFPAAITPYDCDPDDDDLEVEPILELVTVP
ncbi:PKD domain-containing protein [bacterium]|nr:PKD domain-containing protein [bacterium]